MISWLLAALHLLGLGIGLGAVWARSRALRGELDLPGVRRALAADNWWGAAAGLWLVTGLLRAFAGFEKGSAYYLQNHLFLTKMGLLVIVLALEVGPMIGLIRWRRQLRRGEAPDTRNAGRFATSSAIQVVLVLLMVLAATAMARGYGTPAP